ncbi:hypothetical protein ACWGPW_24355 [Paenibacillus chitinolyticus]
MATAIAEKKRRVNPEKLSTSELAQMIRNGQQVAACEKEWSYRWKGLKYPMFQVGDEVKSYI